MQPKTFPHRFLCALALFFTALLCGCEDKSKTALDAAKELARQFAEQRIGEAYEQASSTFRFTRSASYFEARVRDLGLCEARSVAWGEPERHGRLATVRGVFTLKDGNKFPLNFTFALENGGWRLVEARSELTPIGQAKWDENKRLGSKLMIRGVFDTTFGVRLPLNFTFSLEERGWQPTEVRPEPASSGGVRWERPERQDKQVVLRGTFEFNGAGRQPIVFAFTAEDGDVFSVGSRTRDTAGARAVEIMEPNALEIPTEPQLRQLAEDTLLLFNEAVQNGGDFSALYASASDRWKFRGRDPIDLSPGGPTVSRLAIKDPFNNENRLTAAAFRNAFAAAVEAKVDLSPIKGSKMLLSEPVRVNSDGVLRLNGTFDATVTQASMPGEPRRLEFGLEFVREAAKWKLFGITVHVVPVRKAASR